ncbi:hypothetical protein TL16_g04626 [Triparma laevis f. inornata]|uniref:Band 7 domain-containing protein n=1 Tax=Triparma laevis f. inornata TaxID=1714386 RepID=A0A9W7E909_9STRA|nr:hypothetical protein TL16_g04626 [Triparma laevis f. inornata]
MEMKRNSSRHEEDLARGHEPEDTPAYQVLQQHGLLNSTYRVPTANDIDAVPSNSNPWLNTFFRALCCPCPCLVKTFTVPDGFVLPVNDGRGGFHFYGTENHLILDPFYSYGKAESYGVNTIVHGDRSLLVIKQGKTGLALNKGQPILLPPGLHQWKDPVLVYQKSFDLNNNVIRLGPLTLVTVDEGYCAVTEDNGRQVILDGGDTYLLTHRNHKFQKYISMKIQSHDMQRIEATSADNVLMAVRATVIWRITDAHIAAKNSADTIAKNGGDKSSSDLGDITKLTNDVLKQSEASLAAFIGAVNYSDTFNVAAVVEKSHTNSSSNFTTAQSSPTKGGGGTFAHEEEAEVPTASPLFDPNKLNSCVHQANKITKTYGVSITSINVVSAVPADPKLQSSLAQGAVAAAEAQKYETVAQGKARAALVEAKGKAESMKIVASGAAESERIRAHGSRKAADLIEGSGIAVKLALLDKTGDGLKGCNSTIFFGADATKLDEMLAPAVVAAATKQVGGAEKKS